MQAAHIGMTGADLAIGSAVAAVVHAALGLGIWLAPATEAGAAKADSSEKVESCAAVVSTACVSPARRKSVPPPAEKSIDPEDRRCPEPLRRTLRRDLEPPPSVAVDLLQAELVAAIGSETGTRTDPANKAALASAKPAEAPKPKLAEAMGQDTKLGDILNESQGSDQKKKKLGDILGRADGKEGGEGKVNQTGSSYVREVKVSVSKSFSLPASIPPWEAADLSARVRVTRMTASGGVLEWRFEKQSENDDFDGAVRGLLNSYKAGTRSLPAPPPHILDEINSRGFVIELRGGKG